MGGPEFPFGWTRENHNVLRKAARGEAVMDGAGVFEKAVTFIVLTYPAIAEQAEKIDALRAELDKEREQRRSLSGFVEDVSRWRESCREHDDEMGNPPRDFSDAEHWDLLESNARATFDRESKERTPCRE